MFLVEDSTSCSSDSSDPPCVSPYPSFGLYLISVVASSAALLTWPHLMLYMSSNDTAKGGTDLPLPCYLSLHLSFAPYFLELIYTSSGWYKTISFKRHQLIGLD